MDLSPGVFVAGRYEIATLLGEGAFGIVLRVRDRQGRSFALKLLTNEQDDARFAREVEAVRRLQHPNIVQLVDSGVHEGLPFVVFELVAGETLESIIARGPMPIERVIAIVQQLLHALGTAHAMRLVHRDLKPANVMIVGDQVKLLDFGVARSLDPEATNLTRLGEVIGTPQYMSPEQVASIPVDASTDLYALGLVTSEMLTGQPVYAGTLARVFTRLASPERTPIPEAVLRSPLGHVVARATEKSPAVRFRSAREMSDALPRVEIARPPAPRSFMVVILALTAIGVLVAGAGVALFFIGQRGPKDEPTTSSIPSAREIDGLDLRPGNLTEERRRRYETVCKAMTSRGYTLFHPQLLDDELVVEGRKGDARISVKAQWYTNERAARFMKDGTTPTKVQWFGRAQNDVYTFYASDEVGERVVREIMAPYGVGKR